MINLVEKSFIFILKVSPVIEVNIPLGSFDRSIKNVPRNASSHDTSNNTTTK